MEHTCQNTIRDTTCNACYRVFVSWYDKQRKSPFKLRALNDWNKQARRENGYVIYE